MHSQHRYLILQQQLIFQPCIFSSSANGRVLIGIYDVDYLTFALTKAELMDVDGRIKFEKNLDGARIALGPAPSTNQTHRENFLIYLNANRNRFIAKFQSSAHLYSAGAARSKTARRKLGVSPSALPIKHEFYPCAGYEQENGVNFYHGVC
jgi:hypothetical protein